MTLRTQDIVPISEARARLTELAEQVVGGAEKVLTKGGASFVALVDARKLDYYHALEDEHGARVVLEELERGLLQVKRKALLRDEEFNALLEGQP